MKIKKSHSSQTSVVIIREHVSQTQNDVPDSRLQDGEASGKQ